MVASAIYVQPLNNSQYRRERENTKNLHTHIIRLDNNEIMFMAAMMVFKRDYFPINVYPFCLARQAGRQRASVVDAAVSVAQPRLYNT